MALFKTHIWYFDASKYLHFFPEIYGHLNCFYDLIYVPSNSGDVKTAKLNGSKITCTLKKRQLMAANCI